MDRAQKAESIETLKGVFEGAGAVVVTHYLGLTVAEMTDLRGRLRKEGATLKVVKNTLVQKALDGSVGEAGDALFTGPVAIAFAPDAVSAAKVATQYAKDNEFTSSGLRVRRSAQSIKALATSVADQSRHAHGPHPGSAPSRGRHTAPLATGPRLRPYPPRTRRAQSSRQALPSLFETHIRS